MSTREHTDFAPTVPSPPCSPAELRRLRIAGWIVVASGAFVVIMAMTFGNAPRPFVDRMNLFLAPIVIGQLGISVYSLYRFRKACRSANNRRLG